MTCLDPTFLVVEKKVTGSAEWRSFGMKHTHFTHIDNHFLTDDQKPVNSFGKKWPSPASSHDPLVRSFALIRPSFKTVTWANLLFKLRASRVVLSGFLGTVFFVSLVRAFHTGATQSSRHPARFSSTKTHKMASGCEYSVSTCSLSTYY